MPPPALFFPLFCPSFLSSSSSFSSHPILKVSFHSFPSHIPYLAEFLPFFILHLFHLSFEHSSLLHSTLPFPPRLNHYETGLLSLSPHPFSSLPCILIPLPFFFFFISAIHLTLPSLPYPNHYEGAPLSPSPSLLIPSLHPLSPPILLNFTSPLLHPTLLSFLAIPTTKVPLSLPVFPLPSSPFLASLSTSIL